MPNPYAGFSNEQLITLIREIRKELEQRAAKPGEPRRRSGYRQAAEALAEAETHLEQ